MIKKVFGSNVLIIPRDVEEKTNSGIYIPTAKGQKQQIGEVVMVGEGHILEDGTKCPLSVNVGDIVIYAKYAGTQISNNGIDYILLNERDLLVQLEE